MLIPPKKGQVTCMSLLSELAEASCQSPVTSKSVPNYYNAGVYYQYPCGRSRPLIVGGRPEDADELWFT
jgi:hypothetical protein